MSQIAETPVVPRPKRRLLAVMVGGAMLLLGLGAGFGLMRNIDMIFDANQDVAHNFDLGGLAYVPLDPVVVNLPRASGRQFLRFTANLEVAAPYQAEVTLIRPRIIDVLNGYLRAVDPADFEAQAILPDLRGQLLRRVQVVAGAGRVRDLLIVEFVLN